jgi:hypothetical protein
MSNDPSTSDILPIIENLEKFINELEIIPATRYFTSKVLLSLLSKSLTCGRAVCALVDAGFDGEAFGLSRTLVEIFLNVRHITNADTEARAKKYAQYTAKTQQELIRVASIHYPAGVQPKISKEIELIS